MRFAIGLMIVAAFALVAVACGDGSEKGSEGSPEPTASQVPTVPAVVATPIPAPAAPTALSAFSVYWPTMQDYMSVIISPEPAAIQTVEQTFQQYAAVYIAEECVGGRERSADGFRTFVKDTLIFPSGHDRMVLMAVFADSVIASIVSVTEQRIANGLSVVEQNCLRLFTYPETTEDTLIAASLVATVAVIQVNQTLVAQLPSTIGIIASDWFATPGSKVPLLIRLCDPRFSILGQSLCLADG